MERKNNNYFQNIKSAWGLNYLAGISEQFFSDGLKFRRQDSEIKVRIQEAESLEELKSIANQMQSNNFHRDKILRNFYKKLKMLTRFF